MLKRQAAIPTSNVQEHRQWDASSPLLFHLPLKCVIRKVENGNWMRQIWSWSALVVLIIWANYEDKYWNSIQRKEEGCSTCLSRCRESKEGVHILSPQCRIQQWEWVPHIPVTLSAVQASFSPDLLPKNVNTELCITMALSVVSYWYGTCSEGLESRVLRRTFGPKGEEVTECSRKLHDDEEEKPLQSVQP